MASNRTKIAVGLFVLIGLAVAITAILWLGMSNYFRTGDRYAAYFDESVQGLEKDAEVKYRGVTVGRVAEIAVAPDATLVEVIFTLRPESDLRPETGMAVQLQSVGITGIRYLELDRTAEEEAPPSPQLGFEPEHPVVPTRPSDLQRLFKGIDEALDQINALDVKGISDRLQRTIDTVDRSLEAADIAAVSREIQGVFSTLQKSLDRDRIRRTTTALERTADHLAKAAAEAGGLVADLRRKADTLLGRADRILAALHGTSNDLNALISGNRGEIGRALTRFREALESADAFLTQGSRAISASRDQIAYFQRSLMIILQNLEKTSETLKAFAELIATHPAQLLLGEPPPPRQIGGGDR